MDPTSVPGDVPEAIADGERQRVADTLQRAVGAGALTLEEFTARVDVVYTATSRDQLAEATHELQVAPDVGAGRPVRWLVGIFGDEHRSGPWRAGGQVNAVSLFGDVTIDLRGLYADSDEVVIRVWGLFGDARVIVPEGVEVDLSGFCVFGDRELDVAPVPRIPGTPLIRIIAFCGFGDVAVRNDNRTKRWLDRFRGSGRAD